MNNPVQGKLRALVVDDEVIACEIMMKYLNKVGFDTVAVHNGDDALAESEKIEPDVMILDVRMPGTDGLETLKSIREREDEFVVIMLTAVDDTDTIVEAMRNGADDYIRKPVHFEELKICINRAIEKRRLIEENRTYQKTLETRIAEQTAEVRAMNLFLRRTNLAIVRALSEAIEVKDPYTRGHSSRVTAYAMKLGKEAGLAEEQLEVLEYGAILHDIGKIGVRGAVLNKKGKLTDDEYEQVKQHPVVGARIIDGVEFLKQAKEVVLHHHERYDGRGYPDQWTHLQMNTLINIVLIVDSYDAMTSDRPYRSGLPIKKALKELKENSGTQFDPELVAIFIEKQLYLLS